MEYGGLRLLLPLTKSRDMEVVRLAAHALANLSVNADNQVKMAMQGGLQMLVSLLGKPSEQVQRQAAKALANLGVNGACARRGRACACGGACRGRHRHCRCVRSLVPPRPPQRTTSDASPRRGESDR